MAPRARRGRARPRIVHPLDAVPILMHAWSPGDGPRTAALWLDARGYALEIGLGDFPVVYGAAGDPIVIDAGTVCLTPALEAGVVPPGGVALRIPVPPENDRVAGVILASLGHDEPLPGMNELSVWPRIVRNYRDMGVTVVDWLLIAGDIVVCMAEYWPDPVIPLPASP